jgi:hypothetical protein
VRKDATAILCWFTNSIDLIESYADQSRFSISTFGCSICYKRLTDFLILGEWSIKQILTSTWQAIHCTHDFKSRTSKTCTENHGRQKPARKKPKDGRQKKDCTEKNFTEEKKRCTEKKSPGDVVAGCWAAKWVWVPNNYSAPGYQIALSIIYKYYVSIIWLNL